MAIGKMLNDAGGSLGLRFLALGLLFWLEMLRILMLTQIWQQELMLA